MTQEGNLSCRSLSNHVRSLPPCPAMSCAAQSMRASSVPQHDARRTDLRGSWLVGLRVERRVMTSCFISATSPMNSGSLFRSSADIARLTISGEVRFPVTVSLIVVAFLRD